MDDSDESPRQCMVFGPGMRVMLMIALSFACILTFHKVSEFDAFHWLMPSIDDGYPSTYSWFGNMIYEVLVFAVPAIVYTNVFPMERFGYFRLNKPVSVINVALGSLVLIFFIPVFSEVANQIANSLSNPDLIKLKEESDKIGNWEMQMPGIGSLLFCIFANALVPAVCEELFFRAGIQQILLERSRFKHLSIIITALLFTFFHMDPFNLPVIFAGGLVLGYAFYWTGSLRMTILMHFFYNSAQVVLDYLNQHNPSVRAWEPGLSLVIPTALLGAGLLFLLWKRTNSGGLRA